MKERLNEILAHHTKQTVDVITRDSDRDFFMSATEAKAYGLVDEVVKSRKDIKQPESKNESKGEKS